MVINRLLRIFREMKESIEIKPYSLLHKRDCLSAFKSNVPDFFTEEELGQFAHFLDHFESNIYPETGKNRSYFYVLIDKNQVIGCGGFGDKEGNLRISLAWGLIHRDFHHQSFGKLLLHYRLAEIKEVFPGSAIHLNTTQYSAPFYEKQGFELKEISKDFYEKGMHKHELIYEYIEGVIVS